MGAFTDRTGESFVSSEELGAYEFVIVEYNHAKDLWVEFCDKHKARVHTSYQCCRKGRVSNPYHPSHLGVGCLGLMSDGSKPITQENNNDTKEYKLWMAMLRRCYSEKVLEKNPTYKNVNVYERWLVYANFLEDLPKIEGYELWKANPSSYNLDKDIKQQEVKNKVYSLETCCFISANENIKERIDRCGTATKPKKVYGVNVKTGEHTRVFDSLCEASRETNVKLCGISSCLNGRQKTAGGYKWLKL